MINPLEDPDWDARIRAFSQAGFFHSAAWMRVLAGTYGFAATALSVGAPDDPDALIPLVEVDSWLTGRRGITLPFADECGVLYRDANPGHELAQRVIEHGRTRRWKYWECHGTGGLYANETVSTRYWGHRLDLRPGRTALFQNFDESVRRAVRKAEKNGVSVVFSAELDDLRAFHQLLCRTRRRHGAPIQSFAFFRQIHEHILRPGLGWLALARHGNRPVAGAVFFADRGNLLYKFGASDERLQHLRGNNLVMAQAIAKAADARMATLDFGRTSIANEGLRAFKLSWGSAERRIDYLKFDLRGRRFVQAADPADGLASRILARSPMLLSRLAGALLYRHIA